MDEKGLIQLPLKVNGLEIKVVPISPLAKAQNLDEVNEVMQFYQIANALGPGGVAELKPDAIATFVGDKLGIPSELRTSPQEKEAIIQQSMQMDVSTITNDARCSSWTRSSTYRTTTNTMALEEVEEQLRS